MTGRELLALGVTHRRAPVEIRERLAFDDAQLEEALKRLVGLPRIEEGFIHPMTGPGLGTRLLPEVTRRSDATVATSRL